jgi:hypothetical protein
MARRVAALKPQLNRIRAWAHEGSTDSWIAHQLETTAESVRAFRQEHGIERGGPAPLAPITPDSVVEAMLAEEAAALEAGPEPSEPEVVSETAAAAEDEPVRAPRRSRARRPVADDIEGPEVAAPAEEPAADESPEAPAEAPAKPSRRRGARGGAGRNTAAAPEAPAAAAPEGDGAEAPIEASEAEAPLDEEPGRSPRKRGRRRGRGRGGSRGLEARLLTGSVLLLDPAVASDPTFQEHWQDAGALRVEVSTDAIVLRRIAADPEPDRSDR